MAESCLWMPTKGTNTFIELKQLLGHEKAWQIFGIAENEEFINDYKDTLTLDSEGIPTFESLMNNAYIREELGDESISKHFSKQFEVAEDTLDSFDVLINRADKFNQKGGHFVAIVDQVEGGLKINIYPKSQKNIQKAKEQIGLHVLNKGLSTALESAGVGISHLTNAEVKAGRIGVTRFTAANHIAQDSRAAIGIANNMEGEHAFSEEFSHVLVDAQRENPLVARSLNSLKDNVEALITILDEEFDDIYNYYNGDLELVAEEALGKLLREGLVGHSYGGDNKAVINRAINSIKDKFKNIDAEKIDKVVQDAAIAMDDLAAKFLKGEIELKAEDINKANRNASFNALSEQVEKSIELLKQLAEVEAKRAVITGTEKRIAETNIKDILKYAKTDANAALGVMTYAARSLQELRGVASQLQLINTLPTEEKCNLLEKSRTILQSYGTFINSLASLRDNELTEKDKLFDGDFTIQTKAGEVTLNINDTIKELDTLNSSIMRDYNRHLLPFLTKFIEESLGKEAVEYIKKHYNDPNAIENAFKEASADISFTDLWLDSMGDSSNLILQMYDKILKNANDRARNRAYNAIKEIEGLREWAKEKGITDFEFMFEKDALGNMSGNYVNLDADVNFAEYKRQLHELNKSLKVKYPNDIKAREKARGEWLNENADIDDLGRIIPKSEKFPAARLTSTQREVLQKLLDVKSSLDKYYPDSKVDRHKAIQARKDGVQRLMDSSHSISDVITNYKEQLKETFFESEDDDRSFGSTSGLINFDGSEYIAMPVLFTNKLKNPNELSTDIIGSLMSYAIATTKYDELKKIASPLEMGNRYVANNLKVRKTAGQKVIQESLSKFGVSYTKDAYLPVGSSNIAKKLQAMMETHLYQRYIQDEGTFEFFGKQLKTSKVGKRILQMNATAQLGFNWLANMANVTQGIGMQNIEAAAGQFFDRHTLAAADREYASNLLELAGDLGSLNKTCFLTLFNEFLDTKMDFGSKFRDQRNSVLKRLFGDSITFLGQEAGDHWLYSRAAIATCMSTNIRYNGTTMTFYDFLKNHCVQTKYIDGKDTGVKYIKIPEGAVSEDGQIVDNTFANSISHKIGTVNKTCFGIYNNDDTTLANRVVLGQALTQYRKWMKPALNRRFQKKNSNLETLADVEGYYRTTYRFSQNLARDLMRGEMQLAAQWNKLSEEEKANVIRALVEISQFLAVCTLVHLLPDDEEYDDDSWSLSFVEYAARRLHHELGALALSPTFIHENMKTVQSPAAVLGTISSVLDFVEAVFSPRDWVTELQSGPYKGHTRLYKQFMKLPIAPVAYYRQYQRLWNGLDSAIQFYKMGN